MTPPILDLTALREAALNATYFPYFVVDCAIHKNVLPQLLKDFPHITTRGSIPAHQLTYGPYFQQLIDELHHPALRTVIAEKFSLDLSDTYPMLTIRGQTNLRDGDIHTDTPSKLITFLLYLNDEWTESTGNLRLLKDGTNLENYFEEVVPTAGKLLVFKVTPNCWHGHYPFVGKRQTLQLNYVAHHKIVKKELRKHTYSYKFKQFKQLLSLETE